MKYDYHALIIGGGSAGLVAASGLASFGAKTALIEKNKMGGDCLNAGCVPSKTFLKSTRLASLIKRSGEFGLKAGLDAVDLSKVMARVRSVINSIAPHDSKERFVSLGVDVIEGEAVFTDSHTVTAGGRILTGKYIIIASGSRAMVPPIPGLKDVPYLTNENIFDLQVLPKHLIVLGGGPIGLELSQGFRQLGSEVSVIDMLPSLFPKDDQEAAPLMEKKLAGEGIKFYLGAKITAVRGKDKDITVTIEKDGKNIEINGDALLVALGRAPDTKSMGLEKAGVKTDKRGYIPADAKMKTNIPHIFACGDVIGPFQFTHMAGYQAGIVVRNIILPLSTKADYSAVPWATYTVPEVAHVGYTEPWAKQLGLFKDKVIYNLAENDRAKAEGDTEGFIKLIIGKKGRLIGATIVSEKGGEMIALAALAVKKKMPASIFAGIIFPYPTESEIYKFASYEILKHSLKPWMKALVKNLFIR
jgi:pyruvate/2-oxoglutarate dehydrogenase complex dihydrolipoamide dehydrogenase (E3) component